MTEQAEWAHRSAAARQRAEELKVLRGRLVAGEDLDADDLRLARERAEEAARRADQAHVRAAHAHQQAAAQHRAAAEAAEHAGRSELASRHRRAAEADEAEGAADLLAAGGRTTSDPGTGADIRGETEPPEH